jgi:hypothetical protein
MKADHVSLGTDKLIPMHKDMGKVGFRSSYDQHWTNKSDLTKSLDL